MMTTDRIKISSGRTSFCEQKEAKKLYSSWLVGVVRSLPPRIGRRSKSFLVLFFKKEPLLQSKTIQLQGET
jgi:hypothetical protein